MNRFSLRTHIRGMRRSALFSTINVFGLAIGLACFLLIALYIQDERAYDAFHGQADRIIRVTSHYAESGEVRSFARTNPAIGPALAADFPEVEATVRFQRYSGTFSNGTDVYRERKVFFSEASVFQVFDFQMVRGNPVSALVEPGTAVLTQSAALKYFGDEDAMGRTFSMGGEREFQVTGIVEDVPAQSHIQFDILLSFATYQQMARQDGRELDTLWSQGTFYTYALLGEHASWSALESRMGPWLEGYVGSQEGDAEVYSLAVQPLLDIHLSSDLRQELGPGGSATYNRIFGVIAIFVLLISCINFMNLSTARSARKSREVGVRKALGANKRQLVMQFLGESAFMSTVSMVVALILVAGLLPVLNALAGKEIVLNWSQHGTWIPGIAGLIAAVALIAGSYPAFLLSSFQPVKVLKSAFSGSGAIWAVRLRKGLVVFQFTLSIVIIAGTLVAFRQVSFMQDRPLGFDKDQLAVIPFAWEQAVQERFPVIKQEMEGLASVEKVTASGDVPGRMFTTMGYWLEGMSENESGGINALIIEPDFVGTYGLEIVAGVDFNPEQAAGLGESFILNEAAVATMGTTPEEIIGKRFRMNTSGPVIGVVKDFHFTGLQNELEPLVMTVWPGWWGYVTARISTENLGATLAEMEQVWTSVVPEQPWEIVFMDEDFERLYEAERRFGSLFGIFAGLAIFISCLGLFGLTAFTTERRRAEIGVRKVLGASEAGIVVMLNRDMTLLVALAAVLAIPVSWWGMQRWLGSFAYQASLPWWIFLASGMGVIVLTWLTVSWQSLTAARANPVNSIRSE